MYINPLLIFALIVLACIGVAGIILLIIYQNRISKNIALTERNGNPNDRKRVLDGLWWTGVRAYAADYNEIKNIQTKNIMKFRDVLLMTLQDENEIAAERLHQLFLRVDTDKPELTLLLRQALGEAFVEYLLADAKNLENTVKIYRNSQKLEYKFLIDVIGDIFEKQEIIARKIGKEEKTYAELFIEMISIKA